MLFASANFGLVDVDTYEGRSKSSKLHQERGV